MPWLCEWCAIYGKYPPEKAYRPDDEEPVITLDGEKICQSCAKNWQREKKKAEKKVNKSLGSPKPERMKDGRK